MAIMAMTTSSSISVKPRERWRGRSAAGTKDLKSIGKPFSDHLASDRFNEGCRHRGSLSLSLSDRSAGQCLQ